MTIGGCIIFILIVFFIVATSISVIVFNNQRASVTIAVVLIAIALIVATFLGFRWYFTHTASGQRALTDQKSELANGLERIITVYTADGQVIAQYEGIIDIEDNSGGYVIFDYQGRRYTYYNCFVESIAEID